MVVSTAFDFNRLKKLADWKLLLFLVLFLNVKLAVKIPAIALIYLLQFNFKFGFSFKNSRLPLFYLLAIAIAVLNWAISINYFNFNYNIVLLTGIGFWLLCIFAIHQIKLFVEHDDIETIHRTIIIFFILNAAISFFNLAAIIWETGSINPFTYQGQYQKYFIGTGDYIKGLTFDTSTTNAVLNAFGVIYFLTKKNMTMLFVCMIVMLFTGSNFTNIVLLLCFALLFIFRSSRDQKSMIAACTMFLVVFMVKVSPQNYMYVHEGFKNTFHLKFLQTATPPPGKPNLPLTLMPDKWLTPDEIKQKTAQRHIDSVYAATHPPKPSLKVNPQQSAFTASKAVEDARISDPVNPLTILEGGRIIIPQPNINSKPYQHITDTNAYQKSLLAFIDTHKTSLPLSAQNNHRSDLPGKAVSGLQTIGFLAHHPSKILAGDGMGNFSSKLAFKVSGLGFAGGYPQKLVYLNADFLSNHLDVFLNYFSKKTDYHSITNNPDSAYDQLLAEYGLLGLIAFLVWYLGYFLKHYKILTYGVPILVIMMAILSIEYWFEQLSVLVFFELLLLLNIKENQHKAIPGYVR
jgi:hypothetical protein